jgi:hypothetical protein
MISKGGETINKEKELARNCVCPHCGKMFDIIEIKVTIEKPVKGVYERNIIVRKNPQTILNEKVNP